MKKLLKQKIAINLAKFFLRHDRGQSLSTFFSGRFHDLIMAGLLMDLVYRYLDLRIPYFLIIIFILCIPIFFYLIGFVDEKAGFWRVQNNYNSRNLNPYFKEIEEKLERIEDKLK